jgi:ribosomal protein S27E
VIIVYEPEKWWKDLYVACQFCGRVLQMEGLPGEVRVQDSGDLKDEGTVAWECPACANITVTQPSRMIRDSPPLKAKYNKKPVDTGPPLVAVR